MDESGLLGENVCMGGMGGKDFPLPRKGTELVTIVFDLPFPEDGESELDELACGCIWQHWHNGDCACIPAKLRYCSSSEQLRE